MARFRCQHGAEWFSAKSGKDAARKWLTDRPELLSLERTWIEGVWVQFETTFRWSTYTAEELGFDKPATLVPARRGDKPSYVP